jgi:uncharacterized protein YndB with AHSA1/START domain
MTEAFDPGPLADVDTEVGEGTWTLVLSRDLRHAPAMVWAALTEPAQLQEWGPFTADRDLGSPGEATLTLIDGDVHQDIAATVIRAERPRLLEYTWGPDRLRWELDPIAGGTRLTLRQQTADPDMLSKAAAGWHLCLVVAERLLDGNPIGPIRGRDATNYGWDDLNEAYAKRLADG